VRLCTFGSTRIRGDAVPQVALYQVRLRVLNRAATVIGTQQEYARAPLDLSLEVLP